MPSARPLAWPQSDDADEHLPEGVLAVVEAPVRALSTNGSLYLVAVGIEKPGNLGAMARTADAAGADALVVAEAQADPWNPNAIRASTGAVFSLPVVEATLADVKRLPTQLVAAAPVQKSAWVRGRATREGRSAPRRGREARPAEGARAEDAGLPLAWLGAADLVVSIPLRSGATDSLNAATAAAVILFEARRQRDHA